MQIQGFIDVAKFCELRMVMRLISYFSDTGLHTTLAQDIKMEKIEPGHLGFEILLDVALEAPIIASEHWRLPIPWKLPRCAWHYRTQAASFLGLCIEPMAHLARNLQWGHRPS